MINLAAVVFDYGNVLCAPQAHSDLSEMAAVCGLDRSTLEPLYWQFRPQYDMQEFDGTAYWRAIGDQAGKQLSARQISDAIELDCRSWSRPGARVLAWVRELKANGFRTAILSNMPVELRLFLDRCDWLVGFDHAVYSCDVGSMKPDPTIYTHCLQLLNLPADQVLFLDDRIENIEGAHRLGMHAVHFLDAEQTAQALSERFSLPLISLCAI